MTEEWGPWIEHDGRGCPLSGPTYCRVEFADGEVIDHFITRRSWMWDWAMCAAAGAPDCRIIRYRVRKPKGLVILEAVLAGLKQPEDA